MLNSQTTGRRVLTVEADSGGVFDVEVVDDGTDVGMGSTIARLKVTALESTIKSVAQTIHYSLRDSLADHPPTRIEAEFGLKFSGKSPGGVILGELGGESSILVRLVWTDQDRP